MDIVRPVLMGSTRLTYEEDTMERFDNAIRAQLLDTLESIKREHPELDEILKQFQIDQTEYDKTMLTILSAQISPRNTYATDKGPLYA